MQAHKIIKIIKINKKQSHNEHKQALKNKQITMNGDCAPQILLGLQAKLELGEEVVVLARRRQRRRGLGVRLPPSVQTPRNAFRVRVFQGQFEKCSTVINTQPICK